MLWLLIETVQVGDDIGKFRPELRLFDRTRSRQERRVRR
jgi:hypothetical protein